MATNSNVEEVVSEEQVVIQKTREDYERILEHLEKIRSEPSMKTQSQHNSDVMLVRKQLDDARLKLAETLANDMLDKLIESDQVRPVDLSSRGFTEVPDKLDDYKEMTQLDLSYNKLIEFPPDRNFFGPDHINKLTTLVLVGNRIQQFHPDLCECATLTFLDVRWNRLSKLPDELGKLSQLKYLRASYNALTDLPGSIKDLTDLRELVLDANMLAVLPADVGKMKQLELLALSKNPISRLPPLTECSSLKSLFLQFCNITEPSVLDALAGLQSLEILHVGGNSFSELHQIFDTSQIKELDVSFNHELTTLHGFTCDNLIAEDCPKLELDSN